MIILFFVLKITEPNHINNKIKKLKNTGSDRIERRFTCNLETDTQKYGKFWAVTFFSVTLLEEIFLNLVIVYRCAR